MNSNNYNNLLVCSIKGIYDFEHISEAQSWGQSFKEWREGDPKCVTKTYKSLNRPFKEWIKSAKILEQKIKRNYIK